MFLLENGKWKKRIVHLFIQLGLSTNVVYSACCVHNMDRLKLTKNSFFKYYNKVLLSRNLKLKNLIMLCSCISLSSLKSCGIY